MTRLRVGPQSAGALPGPVCYQQGGTMPTVTDADLVLGYIDPEYFLAGTMRLDIEAAKQAIKQHVAEPLEMSIDEAAAGIKRVADSHMADLIRQTTVERGYDPRDFTAFLYGGGGPLHGPAYASQLGLKSMIVPGGAIASVFSAWGIASADIHHTFEISRPMMAPLETSSIQSAFDELEAQANARLEDDGIPEGRRVFQRVVEMRYALQTHEVAVSAPAGELSATAGDELITAFEEAYGALFGEGSGFAEAGVELINFRLHAYGQLTKPKPSAQAGGVTSSNPDPHTRRAIYWPELAERVETPVYQDLSVGSELAGPAVDELQNFVISE
jgi:N-methylhydantoinase A